MQDDYKQAYQNAVKLLARREHGRIELAGKLARKGYPADVLESVLNRLEQEKYLSDERFVEAYIQHRGNRGYGPARIRKELQDKGIPDSLVKAAMDEVELDWFALAKSVRQKKFGDEVPAEWKERARQMRFLQYRGFSQDQIQHCIEAD